MEQLIKNIEMAKVLELESLVAYQEGQVVSRTLAQGKNLSLTLFAFDKGEEISSHSSGGDAMVYILDGKAEITIGEQTFNLYSCRDLSFGSNPPGFYFLIQIRL